MTFAHVAKDAAGQGSGTSLTASVAITPYATGEIVGVEIRHRSTITAFTGSGTGAYLCDSGDTVRTQLTLLPSNTDGTNIIQPAYVVVPSGATYTQVKVFLAAGSTANQVKTCAFTTSAGLQGRDAAADKAFSLAGSSNKSLAEDVTTTTTGGNQLIFAAVVTSATTAGQAATNGFTVASVEVSSPRLVFAWKILTTPTPALSAGATTLSWTNNAGGVVGQLVTLQESSALATVPAAGLRPRGAAKLTLNPSVGSTTTPILAAIQIVGLEAFKLSPVITRYFATSPAIERDVAPPVSAVVNSTHRISTTPAIERDLAPSVAVHKNISTTPAVEKDLAPSIVVKKAVVTVPATEADVAPGIEVVAGGTHDWKWESGPPSTHYVSAEPSKHYESGDPDAP